MNQENILECWEEYLRKQVKYSNISNLYFFKRHHCGTCRYWRLLNADELLSIESNFPDEYKYICKGLNGEIIRIHREKGECVDTYNDHVFFGFCKRYPPTFVESDSVVKWKSLFCLFNKKIFSALYSAAHPITSYEEWCGEWSKGAWIDDYLKNNNMNI